MENSKVIFYVDDDVDDIGVFEETIKLINVDLQVTSFADTTGALEFLEDGELKPDIIFLDINMPKLSGREMLLLIRRMERFSTIPVVMFSTSIVDSVKKEFQQLGATAFLRKASTMSEMQESIYRLLAEHL